MQKVPDEVRKSVVFIQFNSLNGAQTCGTGFLVSMPLEGMSGKFFVYVVTAKHVIEGIRQSTKDQKVFLRFNGKKPEKPIITAETSLSDWHYHPTDNSVDVAVMQVVLTDDFDFLTIPLSMAVTDQVVIEENIGAGDEVFLTGLFHNHYGNQKNLPIIRTGNIAMMPEERVYTTGLGLIDAYLIEARSIGGLSGSPVFVYMDYVRQKNGQLNLGAQQKLFYWLGLMHGHWDVKEDSIDTFGPNGQKHVNMGIGIVVPTEKILEVINNDYFVKMREKAIEIEKAKIAPTADVKIAKSSKFAKKTKRPKKISA
jgi:hypothetical protein